MSSIARILALGGSSRDIEVASATTLQVPPEDGVLVVTGTTTIDKLASDVVRPNRLLIVRGANNATTNLTITSTAIASAASGQMFLGSNFTMTRGKVLALMQQADGVWIKVN